MVPAAPMIDPGDVHKVRPGELVHGVGADIAIDTASLSRAPSGTVAIIKGKVRNTQGVWWVRSAATHRSSSSGMTGVRQHSRGEVR